MIQFRRAFYRPKAVSFRWVVTEPTEKKREEGGLKRGWKQIGHPPLDLLSRRFLSIRLSSFLVKRNPRYIKYHLSGSFSLLARLHASSGFIERHLLNVIFMHIKDEEGGGGGGGGSLMELERVGRLFAKPYLSFVWMDCVGG